MIIILFQIISCFDMNSVPMRQLSKLQIKKMEDRHDHQILKSESVIILNTNFSKCTAIDSLFDNSAGGAIWTMNCTLTIQGCNFQSNIAQYASCLCTYGCTTFIFDSEFIDSSAIKDVGAIWSMGSDKESRECTLTINNTYFRNNRAGRYVGAVASNMSNPSITNCEFTNNSAKSAVGACAIVFSSFFILDSVKFIDNRSEEKFEGTTSPALFLQSSQPNANQEIIFQNCYFHNNVGSDSVTHGMTLLGSILFSKFEYICFDADENNAIEDIDNQNTISDAIIRYNIQSYEQCQAAFETASFSKSNSFLPSSIFSKTEKFSATSDFSESSQFSNTKSFSRSSIFTRSLSFTRTPSFTNSQTFSGSSGFTKSETFYSFLDFIESSEYVPNPSDISMSSLESSETPSEEPSETPTEESTDSEEEIEEMEKPNLDIPALGGGLGGLLLLLLLLLIILCCCRKKNRGGGCCARTKKTKETKTVFVQDLILPRSPDDEQSFQVYPNPIYLNIMADKESSL